MQEFQSFSKFSFDAFSLEKVFKFSLDTHFFQYKRIKHMWVISLPQKKWVYNF